ncbi:hypothetical protein B0H63DRAFT_545151 [Podospora didyma]|uniref:DUF6546 domain-containing protein n=1 Tax=Podospora didyma TaxID=330526 RepID=A0AAE0NG66_9PEZI|nr:hypothetical protein B0H63DRAFT_545151 [Podospora didyma]
MSWRSLSAELCLMILEFAVESHPSLCRQGDRYAFSAYASVCQEWRWIFDPCNSSRIVVDQDRISDLDNVCQVDSEEDSEAKKQSDLVFTGTRVDLLSVLSKWPQRRNVRPDGGMTTTLMMLRGGLSLEVSAFSPSNYRHGFRDFRLQDDYPIWFNFEACDDEDMDWVADRERAERMKLEKHHDPDHGWDNGTQSPVSLGARKRINKNLSLQWDDDDGEEEDQVAGLEDSSTRRRRQLPKVTAITDFTVRRQSYRSVDSASLRKILVAFPNLRYSIHEPWYNINKKLRYTLLFQDSSKTLNPEKPTGGRGGGQGARTRCPLGRALAKTTRLSGMELFSAGFLVDAFDFFHEFREAASLQMLSQQPPPPDDPRIWSNLKRLHLTSGRLNPHLASWKRQEVLLRAGRAATMMPSLEGMALWNGGEGFCYIMRYVRFSVDREPMLVLASTIEDAAHSDFSPQVLAVWRMVPKTAREPSHVDPRIWLEKIKRPTAYIRSSARTVSLLRGVQILHDVTIHQMIAEERFFLPLTDGSLGEQCLLQEP